MKNYSDKYNKITNDTIELVIFVSEECNSSDRRTFSLNGAVQETFKKIFEPPESSRH